MTQPSPLNGITRADFQVWRHSPVTKVFLQFLHDKRAMIERTALDQWVAGVLSLQADQVLRGQIVELFEIQNTPFEQIEAFYQEESSEATTD